MRRVPYSLWMSSVPEAVEERPEHPALAGQRSRRAGPSRAAGPASRRS